MARLNTLRDECGAVYVEFLIAFFPLFLLFLGICQIALIATAEVIVRHAAYAGARTAIVALDDDPKRYDKAERGYLSQGNPDKVGDLDDVARKLGIPKVSVPRLATSSASSQFGAVASVVQTTPAPASALDTLIEFLFGKLPPQPGGKKPQMPQHGARMVPIQTAAMLPLLPIAPSEALMREENESISGGLAVSTMHQLGFAVEYTKAATLVTVHDSPENEGLTGDPIKVDEPVTVRVTYLYHCTIPIVRSMMCGTLQGMTAKSLLVRLVVASALGIAREDARFKVLTATATLPNQGATYQREGDQ